MGSISVACYKPRPGSEQALLDLVRNHLPPLRAEGLVTEVATSPAFTRGHARGGQDVQLTHARTYA